MHQHCPIDTSPSPEPVDEPPVTLVAGQQRPSAHVPAPYVPNPVSHSGPGYPAQFQGFGYPTRINPSDKTNGMAISALILDITGFLLLPACVGLGLGMRTPVLTMRMSAAVNTMSKP